jgi:hypothetical protein
MSVKHDSETVEVNDEIVLLYIYQKAIYLSKSRMRILGAPDQKKNITTTHNLFRYTSAIYFVKVS